MNEYPYCWRLKKFLPERHGQRCKYLAFGKNGNALIEFEDGHKTVSTRYALRRIDFYGKYAGKASLAEEALKEHERERQR